MENLQSRARFLLSRRGAFRGFGSAAAMLLIGCAPRNQDRTKTGADGSPALLPQRQQASMIVYRDPGCGCCEAWTNLAREAGFAVSMIDRTDMDVVKRKHRVPPALTSCHTAVVGAYAIEGHVPLTEVARLLRDKPEIAGLAVPGMPRGSPGMEMPDGTADDYRVVAFDRNGRSIAWKA